MHIHHAMIVRNTPERLFQALTQAKDLEVWLGGPARAQLQVGSAVEIDYDGGERALKMELARFEPGKEVQWRVTQPMWPVSEGSSQVITWTLSPFESSTLVDFRMEGWLQDGDTLASVSYKWATFMTRLKIFMGDGREAAILMPLIRCYASL